MMWGVVRFHYEHTHCWPEAPGEVSFLRHEHRHIFWVEVKIEMQHDDRDVEYIMFKRWLKSEINVAKQTWPLRSSCEMMARAVHEMIWSKYQGRAVTVQIMEDGENGALFESI